MSEYRYYEFLAIDRPLTDDELRKLPSYSTRARLTPTSFVNEYNWGSFKGDADAWMERYFDAFLYHANWGTRVLKLRLPTALLDPATAAEYCGGECCYVRERADKLVVSFVSEDEDDSGWAEEDAEGPRSSPFGPSWPEETCAPCTSVGSSRRSPWSSTMRTSSPPCRPAWASSAPHSRGSWISSGSTATSSRSPRR